MHQDHRQQHRRQAVPARDEQRPRPIDAGHHAVMVEQVDRDAGCAEDRLGQQALIHQAVAEPGREQAGRAECAALRPFAQNQHRQAIARLQLRQPPQRLKRRLRIGA